MWRAPIMRRTSPGKQGALTIQRCWTITDRLEATVLFKSPVDEATVALRQLVAKIVQSGRLNSF